jgi:hypothetical protein
LPKINLFLPIVLYHIFLVILYEYMSAVWNIISKEFK